jgi:hypothetical protein
VVKLQGVRGFVRENEEDNDDGDSSLSIITQIIKSK